MARTVQPPATGAAILAAVHELREVTLENQRMLSQRASIVTLAAEIADRIFKIEDHLAGLIDRMERIENVAAHRHKVADKRAERVDRYVLDDAFNLHSTNTQLIEVFNALRQEIYDLKHAIKHESDTTRKAVALHMSDPERAHEHGRG